MYAIAPGLINPHLSGCRIFFIGCPRQAIPCAYSTSGTVPDMRQIPTLVHTKVVRPAESALALRLITTMELLRLSRTEPPQN